MKLLARKVCFYFAWETGSALYVVLICKVELLFLLCVRGTVMKSVTADSCVCCIVLAFFRMQHTIG